MPTSKKKSQPSPKLRSPSKQSVWRTLITWLQHTNVWQRIGLGFAVFLILWVGTCYGIAQWYIFERRNEPIRLGTTFIAPYARDFGLNPEETFKAILTELQPSQVRLVSYWDQIEAKQGTYDYSDLDWQMAMAEKYNTPVSLALGLRQPRWPECHMPKWAMNQPRSVWYPQLKDFMNATIDRYKSSPVLQSYQLENEYFLSVFGECTNFDRDRLVDEYNLVKTKDPAHPVIISRSNNAIGFPLKDPQPDLFGVSVYKRVWDKTLTKRYFEYPFPAWFYGFLAGGGKILTGKDMIIHELQAESWTPDGYDIKTAPTEELYKSMNPDRLRDRFEYAEASGIKQIDLWGSEWWYAMRVKRGEPGLWNAAKAEYAEAREHNRQLKARD